MTLKERLKKEFPDLTDNDFASHFSDLYVIGRVEIAQFLKRENINFSYFVGQTGSNWAGSGKTCIEINFRNEEHFEKRVQMQLT